MEKGKAREIDAVAQRKLAQIHLIPRKRIHGQAVQHVEHLEPIGFFEAQPVVRAVAVDLGVVAQPQKTAGALETFEAEQNAALLDAHKGEPGRHILHAKTVEQRAQNVGGALPRDCVDRQHAGAPKVEHVGGVAVMAEDEHAGCYKRGEAVEG